MDKYQKQVQLELLEHENKNKKRLTANYKAALGEIKKQIAAIMEAPDFAKNKMTRAKWNQMLEAQLNTILHRLGEKNVSDMTDYLNEMYKEGYLGCLYGIHQDGVGLVLHINEDKVERSANRKTEDLKFSERLYENADKLKEDVKAEMARGFSTGADYIAIARQVSLRSGVSLGRACTIARTEGHRVTEESRLDCMKDSVEKGADIVKQWDSTLDDITRGTHRELDGQIKSVDEPFEIPSTGAKAMYPGGFGIAKEDINCRCATLTRAKWALGDEEYKYSRFAGDIVSISSKQYEQWKKGYEKEVIRKNTLLSDVDKRALYDYMSFKSYPLNEALRNHWELTEEQENLISRLDAAVDKLPEYKGNLSRSLTFNNKQELDDFIERMKIGSIKCFGQYLSCTYGDCYNPDGNVHIFIQNASKGKDLSGFNDAEKEVIYKRDVQFAVLNVKMIKGTYYILLEEAVK